MAETIFLKDNPVLFIAEVKAKSSCELFACNLCGKCTAGCRFSAFMDYPPHLLMRAVQLGLKKELLSSSALWLCAGCMVCEARCPRNLSVSKVAEALRQMAVKEKIKPGERNILKGHKNFLSQVLFLGRLNEPLLILQRNLSSGKPFKDLVLGLSLFLKGKLRFLPSRAKIEDSLKKFRRQI